MTLHGRVNANGTGYRAEIASGAWPGEQTPGYALESRIRRATGTSGSPTAFALTALTTPTDSDAYVTVTHALASAPLDVVFSAGNDTFNARFKGWDNYTSTQFRVYFEEPDDDADTDGSVSFSWVAILATAYPCRRQLVVSLTANGSASSLTVASPWASIHSVASRSAAAAAATDAAASGRSDAAAMAPR